MPLDFVSRAIGMALMDFTSHSSGTGSVKEVHLVNIKDEVTDVIANTLSDMADEGGSNIKIAVQGVFINSYR